MRPGRPDPTGEASPSGRRSSPRKSPLHYFPSPHHSVLCILLNLCSLPSRLVLGGSSTTCFVCMWNVHGAPHVPRTFRPSRRSADVALAQGAGAAVQIRARRRHGRRARRDNDLLHRRTKPAALGQRGGTPTRQQQGPRDFRQIWSPDRVNRPGARETGARQRPARSGRAVSPPPPSSYEPAPPLGVSPSQLAACARTLPTCHRRVRVRGTPRTG